MNKFDACLACTCFCRVEFDLDVVMGVDADDDDADDDAMAGDVYNGADAVYVDVNNAKAANILVAWYQWCNK